MDANCYHLRYVDTRDGLQPPQGAELYNQLNGAPLHAGDTVSYTHLTLPTTAYV